MLTQNYLRLESVRLRRAEQWRQNGSGLTFVFPTAGAGIYVSGTETHRLAPGDVLLLKERSPGTLSVWNGGETVFWTFCLSLEHLFPLFDQNEISLLQDVVESLPAVRLYPAATPIATESHRLIGEVPPNFNLEHRGQLLRVATSILTNEFSKERQKHACYLSLEEHLIQVFEKLTTDDLLGLSVEQLAEKFGCSERHLNRLFHCYFGFSVTALKMELRLIKAVALLRDPNIKIISVAEQCGFNHLGLFNTCFSRRFGSSPGRWRKARRQAHDWPGGLKDEGLQRCLLEKGLFHWTGCSPSAKSGSPADLRGPKAPNFPDATDTPVLGAQTSGRQAGGPNPRNTEARVGVHFLNNI